MLSTFCIFPELTRSQLIRDDLRASTGADGGDWWRGNERARGDEGGEREQEEAHIDNLEEYVELLYEGKDKVRYTGNTVCTKCLVAALYRLEAIMVTVIFGYIFANA